MKWNVVTTYGIRILGGDNLNIKELKITNNSNDSITFGRQFFLTEDFQISGLKLTSIEETADRERPVL